MVKPNWQPTKAEFWKNLPAPARPWPSEVKWFEKYVKEKKRQGKKDILILGSTVEFRSLCHKYKVNVHVVDFSLKFYKILSRQKMAHRGKETFYEQNWLTMKLNKKFDLIFGDWVPGVLHTKDYDRFYKNLLKHLKDDGLFIGRECLRPNRQAVNLETVVKKHYQEHARRYSFYESSMQYVYGYRPDSKTAMWNMAAARQAIEAVNQGGLFVNPKDYKFMKKALSIEQEASASVMVKADFEKKLKKYLTILAEHHVSEPSSNWYPIYVCRKKNIYAKTPS